MNLLNINTNWIYGYIICIPRGKLESCMYGHCYHNCDNIDWEYEKVLSLADTVNLRDKPKLYANSGSI